jgi:hypothetical protein
MLPRPRLFRKWRARKNAVAENKASGKAQGEYPSAGDDITIVDSRQDSDEGDHCSEENPEIKCAAILVNLRALIEEAKAAIQLIQARTKPAVDDDGEKDNQDIRKLSIMIDEAKFTIEVLDSKVSNYAKEERLRLLFDDAQYVISQVMSAPEATILESGSQECAVKSALSNNEDTSEVVFTDASQGDKTRESDLKGLTEEVRLLTGLGDTSKKQIATEESAVEESMEGLRSVKIDTTEANEVDDRNFFVLIMDMFEEFGGMIAEDSAKLAEKARFPHCGS